VRRGHVDRPHRPPSAKSAIGFPPRSSRLRPGLYLRFALRFRLVEEMTRNLISLVSVLSTPTRGLGAVLAAHASSYSHVRFVRRELAKAASRRLLPLLGRAQGLENGQFEFDRARRVAAQNNRNARSRPRRPRSIRATETRSPIGPGGETAAPAFRFSGEMLGPASGRLVLPAQPVGEDAHHP
jgi:hypothetical protein